MVFDRNAINTGRRIQDFGLCDLQGIYQNSVKMRAKGYLVVAFLEPTNSYSIAVAKQLQDWTSLGDKVAIVALTIGERADAEKLVADTGITYPVLWDFETYITPLWAVSAVPTVFITDAQGVVLGRVSGANTQEFAAAKDLLAETIRKADEVAKAAADAAAAAAQTAAAPAASPSAKK